MNPTPTTHGNENPLNAITIRCTIPKRSDVMNKRAAARKRTPAATPASATPAPSPTETPAPPAEAFFTIAQAAEFLNVGRKVVDALIHERKLTPFKKVGYKGVLLSATEVHQLAIPQPVVPARKRAKGG